MGCEVSRAFATCLRVCGLIREQQRKIFGVAGASRIWNKYHEMPHPFSLDSSETDMAPGAGKQAAHLPSRKSNLGGG